MDQQEFESTLKAIESDRERGASELARESLAVMAESARRTLAADWRELHSVLQQRATALIQARPSMTPLNNLLTRWLELIGQQQDDEGLAAMRVHGARYADELIEYSVRAVAEAAHQAAEHLGSDRTLMTHSLSSTVLAIFRGLKDDGVKAIITESRPLFEGRLLATRLSEWQIPTTLITEAQAGLFVEQADAVILGADSLLPDGSLINKSGSYLLALAARDRGIPVYVCCERFKRRTEEMGIPELEEMGSNELDMAPLPHLEIRNIYFDITPAHLINAWFDEQGMHPHPAQP